MQAETKLIFIKITHTLVWCCFNVVIFYMLYTVAVNKIGWGLWMGYGIVLVEGLVLFAFNYVCPLTIVAHKYQLLRRIILIFTFPTGWPGTINQSTYVF